MSQKVIVITGSSSGIGETLANYFLDKGHKVYGLSRSKKEGTRFKHIPTDVSNWENVYRSIQQINYEAEKIDVVINNAGIGMLGAIEDATQEDFHKLFDVNVMGAVHVLKAVLPIMREQKSGHILNVSSIASNHGLAFRGYYSASKSAIDRITEAARFENKGTGIEITTLNFGDIKTPIAESRISSTVSPFYKEPYAKIIKVIDEEVDQGYLPEKLISPIEKLISKKNLKPHYYFGKRLQKFSITLKRVLGQRMFEKLLSKFTIPK